MLRSRSKKSLLTFTKEEKKEIKAKKIQARIDKVDRRKVFLEREADKLQDRKAKLLAELFSDEEEKMNSDDSVV